MASSPHGMPASGQRVDAVDARDPVKRPPPEGGFKRNLQDWRPEQYRAWVARYFFGTWTNALEADFRAGWEAPAANVRRRGEFTMVLVGDATAHPKVYAGLRAPALALWGQKTAANLYPWLGSAPAQERAEADAFVREVRMQWERAGVQRFESDYAGAQVLPVDGAHYFYITNRDATVTALNDFFARIGKLDSRQ